MSTALLYQIIVEERLELARVVVASSQAAMGEGLYRCPLDGEQTPGMRSESALAAGQWEIACPACGGPWRCRRRPSASPTRRTRTACPSWGKRWLPCTWADGTGCPPRALRYSIVQGPRQSVFNAYSGACRIFCLHYRQSSVPTLYEDGRGIRDYVNIDDVVDANILVLEDDRAVGNVFNVGGGVPVTTKELAEIVMRQYGSDRPRHRSRRVPVR